MNNFDRAEKVCYDRLRKANKNTKNTREIELEKKLKIAVKALKSAFGGFKTIQHMAAYPITHFSHPKDFNCLFSGAVDKCAEIKQALKEIEG